MAARQMSAKIQAMLDWACSLQQHAPVSPHHERAVRELRPFFAKVNDGSGPNRALEIGAGEPPYLIARMLESWGWDVQTLDCLSTATYKADAHDIPLADGQFDIVIARHVLEHVLIPPLVLSEMRRVSRKHLLVIVPWVSDKAIDWPDHLYVLPQRGWECMFDKLGLQVERFEEGDHTEQFALDENRWQDREWRWLLSKKEGA